MHIAHYHLWRKIGNRAYTDMEVDCMSVWVPYSYVHTSLFFLQQSGCFSGCHHYLPFMLTAMVTMLYQVPEL